MRFQLRLHLHLHHTTYVCWNWLVWMWRRMLFAREQFPVEAVAMSILSWWESSSDVEEGIPSRYDSTQCTVHYGVMFNKQSKQRRQEYFWKVCFVTEFQLLLGFVAYFFDVVKQLQPMSKNRYLGSTSGAKKWTALVPKAADRRPLTILIIFSKMFFSFSHLRKLHLLVICDTCTIKLISRIVLYLYLSLDLGG